MMPPAHGVAYYHNVLRRLPVTHPRYDTLMLVASFGIVHFVLRFKLNLVLETWY